MQSRVWFGVRGVCVHANVLTQLTLLISGCVVFAAAKKMFHMIYQSVMWAHFRQVKFILISLQLSFSLLCFWFLFFLPCGKHSSSSIFLLLCHLHYLPCCLPRSPAASILPPFSAVCLQMKRAACQFFIFLGSKVASQLPGDGERGDLGLAKGYICTMCLWKKQQRRGRDVEREKRKEERVEKLGWIS